MYYVEKLIAEDERIVKRSIVCETEKLEKALSFWNDYASGINDVDRAYPENGVIPFANQDFGEHLFYRIFEK